jgi:hypothetical protein
MDNCRVTLSGEANILTKDFKASILQDEELYYCITEMTNEAQSKLSYIDFEVARELHQITVKMFTFNALCMEDNLLEGLRYHLQTMLDSISCDRISIRANLSGSIKTWSKTEKFMLLYVKGEVIYKITESVPANYISCKLGKLLDVLLKKLQIKAETFDIGD